MRMNTKLSAVTAVLACALCPQLLAAASPGEAPKVARVVPADGSVDVPPSTKQIRVEFDRDMDDRGMSFVGGGSTFPPAAAKPRWLDKRTCVLPVTLEADHYYRFGLNGGRFRNFRSADGVALAPRRVEFATAPHAKTAPLTPRAARAAMVMLRAALKTRYAYLHVHRADWDSLFAAYRARLLTCKGRSGFALQAGRMLAAAKDIHIWLTAGGQTFPTYSRFVQANFSQAMLARRLDGATRKRQSMSVISGTPVGQSPKVGYLLIASWGGPEDQTAGAAIKALRQLQAAGIDRLIVDVRPNSGGSEFSARALAGCFVPNAVLYAAHVNVDPTSLTGFTPPIRRVLRPNSRGPAFRGRLAVLMGPANMSSCEAFLLMMKQVRNCVLVGARSYGASGNPKPVDLGNGVKVYLPTWKAMTPLGETLETEGIAPHVEVKTVPADVADGKDPVLDKAVELLTRKRKPTSAPARE